MRRRTFFTTIVLATASYLGCSTSSSTGTGGTSADGGTSDGSDGVDGGNPGSGGGAVSSGASVLQRHKNASRDGLYIDPSMTKAAAKAIHRDPSFNAAIQGPVYAQPLYVEKGAGGKPTLYVVSEQDIVYALDAMTGAVIWQKTVGKPVAQSFFECANIDPIGITGTPVIDITSRAIFFDAITTPDDGTTKKHMIFGMGLDDGSMRKGYPIDVEAKVKLTDGFTFDSGHFQQRAALIIMKNGVYVPYGGYAADCGNYTGTILGFQLENPNEVHSWNVPGKLGGIWGPGGPSSDGSALYTTTGNQDLVDVYYYGDSVLKLGAGPTFSKQTQDWFTPSNRKEMDAQDLELGGTGPVLFELPGNTPSKLLIAFAKNGNVYILDRANFGGTGKGDGNTGEGLASMHVATNYIINAPAVYTTTQGTYAVFKGAGVGCPTGSSLTAIKLTPNPLSIKIAWCADHHGEGSPIVTSTDGKSDAIVWAVGAEGSTKLHAFDGDTGVEIFDGGPDTFPAVARYQSPIVASGRVYWATMDSVMAFTVK